MQYNVTEEDCWCKICGELKTESRGLACNHSFCTLCLSKLPIDFQNKLVTCPICYKQTQVKSGVLSLPRAHYLDDAIQFLKHRNSYSTNPYANESISSDWQSQQPTDEDWNEGFTYHDDTTTPSEYQYPRVEEPESYIPPTDNYTSAVRPVVSPDGSVDYFSGFNSNTTNPPPLPPKDHLPPQEPEHVPHHDTTDTPTVEIVPPIQEGESNSFFSGLFEKVKEGLNNVMNTINPPEDITSTKTGSIQQVIYASQFTVTEQQANGLVSKWFSSLWFAPTDLRTTARLNMRPMWVPYYIFSADCTSKYYGYQMEVTGRSIKIEGDREHTYKDMLVCGCKDREIGKFLEQFQDSFRYSDARIPINEMNCPVDNPEPWENIWRDYNTNLQRHEYDACEKLAKKQNLDKIEVLVGYNDIRIKTVYLPVYYGHYTYNNQVNRIAIHGQNGTVIGEKNYGSSVVGRFVGKLWGK